MRLVRVAVGFLLLVLSVPVIFAGAGLWFAMRHDAGDGRFTATFEPTGSDGRAVVVTDVDALLRAEAPFARGGQTELSLSARGGGGPLFLGLAPYSDVERYLADAPRTELTRVRLAHGALPVDLTVRPGTGDLAGPPTAQNFWLATSTGLTRDGAVEDALTWSPSSVRGQRLAIVVMNGDGAAGVDVTLTAGLRPGWLPPTAWGLLILGTALLLLSLLAMGWPQSRRETLYIIEQPAEPEEPAVDDAAETDPAGPPMPPVPAVSPAVPSVVSQPERSGSPVPMKR